MFNQLSKKDLTLMEQPENRLGSTIAVLVSLVLASLVVFIGVYPCGYYDVNSSAYAGYGHHSLSTVMTNGFRWDSDTVPEEVARHSGDGPYEARAELWVAALYVPVFISIIFLGLLIHNNFARVFVRFRDRD